MKPQPMQSERTEHLAGEAGARDEESRAAWARNQARRRLLIGAAVLNVALLAVVAYAGWSLLQTRQLDDYGAAPSFRLTDQLGRTVSADDLRGEVVVVNFIYTSCRDTCPLLSLRMQALQERLRDEQLLGDRVQLLSFTVDPEHDTVEVLRAYAERHDADPQAWRFLTGKREEVVPVIERGFFQAVVPIATSQAVKTGHPGESEPHEHAEVMHSNRFILVDRQGRMRAFYDGLDLDLDLVLRDVRQLLR